MGGTLSGKRRDSPHPNPPHKGEGTCREPHDGLPVTRRGNRQPLARRDPSPLVGEVRRGGIPTLDVWGSPPPGLVRKWAEIAVRKLLRHRPIPRWRQVLLAFTAMVLCAGQGPAPLPAEPAVDTALIVSVDVSGSVDERRYQLQMQGIATALTDPSVIDALLNGAQGGILFTMVTWTDRPQVAVPWTKITSRANAEAVADLVRRVPRQTGDFTCLGRMMRYVSDKVVPQIPLPAARVVLDVSGDGTDNCNPEEPVVGVRDELVLSGITINGLPILEGREAETLEGWYRENVMGGPGAFVLPANGYDDFGRAIRQKFVVEVSQESIRRRVR